MHAVPSRRLFTAAAAAAAAVLISLIATKTASEERDHVTIADVVF